MFLKLFERSANFKNSWGRLDEGRMIPKLNFLLQIWTFQIEGSGAYESDYGASCLYYDWSAKYNIFNDQPNIIFPNWPLIISQMVWGPSAAPD